MINTFEGFKNKVEASFHRESLIEGRFSPDYSFSGVKTVKIITPVTVAMTDYTRSGANRYGTPTEMQDTVQELTLTQDKGFSITIDKGNNMDQGGVKAACSMLALQTSERAIPEFDRYCFASLAQKAGRIVGNSAELTKTNICARISEATEYLDDAEVPQTGRTLFVSSKAYKQLRLSSEFLGVETLAYRSLAKGQVGEYDNMAVVKVPGGRWPLNVNFIVAYKYSASAPIKISETKFHEDPPGISGNLLEGRQYYDMFVFAAKCDGIYVEVDTASGKGTVAEAPAISSAGAFTSATTGASFKFTVDGSDPRYSPTAKLGTASDVTAAGTVVKAFAYVAGGYPSGVTSKTL